MSWSITAFWKRRGVRKEFHRIEHKLAEVRHADDDILSDAEKTRLNVLLAEASVARKSRTEAAFLDSAARRIAEALAPKPHQALRNWADTLAVAFAVAFGIRGLFAQPFKIPTSSMQPTLYGIHFVEKSPPGNPLLGKLPPPLETVLFSTRRARLELPAGGGTFDPDSFRAVSKYGILTDTEFAVGSAALHLPGAPGKVAEYSNLEPRKNYGGGEVLCDGYLSTGDHLFVDRISVYLTGLKRGDVTVFNTEGISLGGRPLAASGGYYYIKRLAGLPGDTLKIVDNHLWVKPRGAGEFKPIEQLDRRFEKIYSMRGGYHGHTNLLGGMPGEYLADNDSEFTVPDDSYFMLGDNSYFSSDSRAWGVVPRRNIVGKASWVFWPFSRRWGPADRPGPVAVPTGGSARGTFPSMYLQ